MPRSIPVPHLLRAMCRGLVFCTLAWHPAAAQPFLSDLSVGGGDPLYATYAAPLQRSEFIVDEGYRFRFYTPDEGIGFDTDTAGRLSLAFRLGDDVRYLLSEMGTAPVVTTSYGDVVRYHYAPFPGIRVDAVFQVYSSRLALFDLQVTNQTGTPVSLDIFPFLHHPQGVTEAALAADARAFTFDHLEPPDDWTTSHGVPYAGKLQDILLLSTPADDAGAYPSFASNLPVSRTTGKRATAVAFMDDLRNGMMTGADTAAQAQVVAFRKTFALAPGVTRGLRIIRGVAEADTDPSTLRSDAEALLDYDPTGAVRADEALYAAIPVPPTDDPDLAMMYWNAFTLMRQVMLPPEGRSSYNYYVFSREPSWGWGHGGQVFHESLSMLAYALMDPESAMNSQRVYIERQRDDGYINYRTGAYLDETIPYNGSVTTSAPWFNWENWELYRMTGDDACLRDAYDAGAKFYRWWLRERDRDGDGLAEWGGHAVLESVRDSQVAVWDQVGWPAEFEGLDLNVMLVREARALADMAGALGDSAGAASWTEEAEARTERINATFWDGETGFFYNVDRRDNDFTYKQADDLKRREIIGLLPLWAGTATPEQAARLVEHLTDPDAFWRPYGVPTLAADDPYYDPMGYWNGPVWVEWQYLIVRGLLDYGYRDLARELAYKVFTNVVHHLATDHTFWELYSPDDLQAGFHQTYIWTGLVARMLLDVEGRNVDAAEPPSR